MRKPGDRKMGDAIRAAREAKRLTRKEVSEALSLNDQYLYQVETGRRRPTLETLWEIAKYLGLNPHELDPRLASSGGSSRST
jgi:transcriptional regulator with XRE-family HTH domain